MRTPLGTVTLGGIAVGVLGTWAFHRYIKPMGSKKA